MNRIAKMTIGAALLLGVATSGAAVDRYRAYQAFRIDRSANIPARDELLRPSYIDGLSHGQVAILKQYSRLYPNATIDAQSIAAGQSGGIQVSETPFPQIILTPTECIVKQQIGYRQGRRCVAYG